MKFIFNFSNRKNIILYIFFKFSLQYAINFEFCQNMQKYAITSKYSEICKKKISPLVSNYNDSWR
jgi:hypothetical protein